MAEEQDMPKGASQGDQNEPAGKNLAGQARASYEQSRQKGQELERRVESYVRQNPVRTLGVAAGVGLLLGVLWTRK